MKKEYMLDLYEGMRVAIEPSAHLSNEVIFGRVRGVSTIPIAVIGRTVIIEPDVQIGEFTCVPVFEIHLKAAC